GRAISLGYVDALGRPSRSVPALAGPANEQPPTHTARGDEDAGLRLWRREVERLRRLGALPSLCARRPAEGQVAPRERPATGQRSALVSVSHSQGRERGPYGNCEAAGSLLPKSCGDCGVVAPTWRQSERR